MRTTMPKTVTVTKTFTYDVAEWIAEYEVDMQNGGRVHPHNHGEYDVRYIIPPLDTSNPDDVVEWIIDEATSDNWHVSNSDQSVTVYVGEWEEMVRDEIYTELIVEAERQGYHTVEETTIILEGGE